MMRPFRLERYFDLHEFTAHHLLSPSDCETIPLAELLALARPETLELWNGLSLGYTETRGHPRLRAVVARRYESASPDGVMVAVPEEAIFVFMQSLLGPGDRAVVLVPAYQSLHEVARSTGCQVDPWTLRPSGGTWHLDFDELGRLLATPARLIVVNFPHNPTGYLPSREEFDFLVRTAREHGAYLLGDEMYRDLEHDPAARLPATCDAYEKGISLAGLSKSYGLPGLRTGWLATRETALVEQWLAVKDYTTICHSAPGEILAIMGLEAADRLIARNRAIVLDNLAAARAALAAHPRLFAWLAPQGGSVIFPRWTGPAPVEDFCAGLLAREGVMAVPGSLFDYPGGHFRVGLGRRNFPEALAALDRYCRAAFA